jgi:hypothetical protein
MTLPYTTGSQKAWGKALSYIAFPLDECCSLSRVCDWTVLERGNLVCRISHGFVPKNKFIDTLL